MSFFDKLFSHKNRIYKNENGIKTANEPSSFSSSNLIIPKEQIRFVLFRECERRGRKLLFDSNAVEKLPLPSSGIKCSQKCPQQSNEKIMDFIETTNTHGYKYKKPSNDVTCLGEMIFGSVAMVYRGENSCKIHSIPSPKQLMFTTIVHAPSRCHLTATSNSSLENSAEGSLASLNEIINEKQTSSSDSKLYRHEGVTHKYSSTYPLIKPNLPLSKIIQCCEVSDIGSNLTEKSALHRNNKTGCLNTLCVENPESSKCISRHKRASEVSEKVDVEELCNTGPKNFDFEGDSSCNSDSLVVLSNVSVESENMSSVSGSLSSLRRRWAQSYSTSLDSTSYQDTINSPSKRRTKLGMALVLDLSNTLQDEMEKFLYNHTIIIDSIMNKIQSSVELAYIRNENFVDLIYTAFLDCQQSVYELIAGRKYARPTWISMFGDSNDDLEALGAEKNVQTENNRAGKRQDLSNSSKSKFLNDFCDVLTKFDTKDTNFFISTLLTAVLTHHLSWVTVIAEASASTRQQILQSVIKKLRPYNPLWAQLNDLYGLLGSPLKCSKTVVTGCESKRCHISAIIQVLTYFIRCYNVVENIFEVDIEDVIKNPELERKNSENAENFDSDIDPDMHRCSILEKVELKSSSGKGFFSGSEVEESSDEEQDYGRNKSRLKSEGNSSNFRGVGRTLRRSRHCLSDLKLEDSVKARKLYPDIKDLAKRENISVSDLDYVENERTNLVEKFLSSEKLSEKIQKLIRVPNAVVKTRSEGYLSPDEGYDTIDSSKAEDIFAKKVHMEKQGSATHGPKENCVFVLGENDELVNLQKKVILTNSSLIDLEKEDSKELIVDNVGIDSGRTKTQKFTSIYSKNKTNIRTLDSENNTCDRTLCANYSDAKNDHSCNKDRCTSGSRKIPWMIRELRMPGFTTPCRTKQLDVSSVVGGVNQYYNSEQVIQGVIDPRSHWELTLQKDLFLCAHNAVLEKDVSEALCIVGDVDSWEVSICSSHTSIWDRNRHNGIRVGMSQLVADMLESLLFLHKINLSPNFCLLHIEKKLHEIYLKSKTVAELLNSTELCSIDYLTARLDIGINDVPLLLSVATTHSPHISEKYGLTFT